MKAAAGEQSAMHSVPVCLKLAALCGAFAFIPVATASGCRGPGPTGEVTTFADEPAGQALSPSVVRWFPTQEALDKAPPSHALELQPKRTIPLPPEFPIKPTYGKAESRTTARIDIKEGDSLYGVGREHGAFLRNGQDFGQMPVGTPWVLCVRSDGSAFGAFADTTYATAVDLTKAIEFTSDDPNLCVTVITAASPREVVVALNEITGRMEMPPLWALGSQQFSAFSYLHLRQAAKWLRESQIPAGALWLAVDKRTWPLSYPAEYVPDAKGLLEEMKTQGFKVVGVIGKGVADHESAPLYGEGINGGHFVKHEDGNLHREEIEERPYLIPDWSQGKTRTWYAGLIKDFVEPGISGISTIRWSTGALPGFARLQADPELGGPDSGVRYQDVLNTQWVRSIREGFDAEKANRRPFIMVDARAIGTQRYTGAPIDWPASGTEWPRQFLAAALNTAMSGQPFLATMVKPPFQGQGSEPNLRWIGVAATFPVTFGSFFLPEDLTTFPPEAQKVMRQAMERRARLIPYLYTQCFTAFFSCEPIMRPLFFSDPTDPTLRSLDTGFMIGNDLLILPRLDDGPRQKVPLKGNWKRLDFGDSDSPWLPELYLRPGAILPLGPLMQYPGEKPLDPITIVANPDESGQATGFIYEDAGEGYEFYKNQARRIGYRIVKEGDAYLVRLSNLDFALPIPKRKLEIQIITDSGILTGHGSERGTVKIPIPVSENK